MSEQSSPSAPVDHQRDLDLYLIDFLAALEKTGYAEKTRHDKERLIGPFVEWVGESNVTIADIGESSIDSFLFCPARRRYKQRTALHQFVEYLRQVGTVPPRHSEPSSAELLVRRYVGHLRENQGLSPHSISGYSPFARAFAHRQRLPDKAAVLDRIAVSRYQLDQSRNRSASYVKLLAAALRSFLRFCFLDGTTAADLSTGVQPVRRSQLAALPTFLTAEQVEHVIEVAATDRSTASGRRTFAILLLLARLGLRASEIVALQIEDIRWDVGEIVIRGKGGSLDRLPLPQDVGEALALHLREAPPQAGSSRRVFLRLKAPHVGLSGPTAVCVVAREALQRTGLLPSSRVGAHIFRHSLATRMIRRGASLAEISQVLRHRSTTTTLLYAKVELKALGGIALPWPSAEASR